MLAQYICKNTKNIQKSDYMDEFCLQGELDLTLFYKIEGYWGIFDNPKSLMTENDRDFHDRIHEYMYPYTLWASLLVMSKLPHNYLKKTYLFNRIFWYSEYNHYICT